MSRFIAVAAVALGHVLGLARPLGVPPIARPLVLCVPGPGQVARIPALPGRYTPQTGGEP